MTLTALSRMLVAMLAILVLAAIVVTALVFTTQYGGASYAVDIVDVIVQDWSNEAAPNFEPTLAVDQTNPDLIAVTAFYIGAGGDSPPFCPIASDATLQQSDSGGVLVSTDGGGTWSLRCLLPTRPSPRNAQGAAGTFYQPPVDATLAFASKEHALIGAYISPVDWSTEPPLTVGRAAISRFPGAIDPDVINVRWWSPKIGGMGSTDQPQVAVPPKGPSSQFVVGAVTHDANICLNGGVLWNRGQPLGNPVASCVNARTSDSNWSFVRATIHSSGRLYAALIRARTGASKYDLVLLSGQVGASGAATFNALSDVGSGEGCGTDAVTLGNRLRCNVPYSTDPCPVGKNQVGSEEFSLAVDPRDAAHVFIAYGEKIGTSINTIHLAETTDAGKTLSEPFFDVDDAINPAVAVDEHGRAALLFQQVVTNPVDDSQWWSTRIRIFGATHSQWTDITLSVHPVDEPAYDCSDGYPLLGDYVGLRAVGSTFYGVFSADNNPYWHPSARYLRDINVSGGVRKLPATVEPSIDPFFFKISPKEVPFVVTLWNQPKTVFFPDDPRIPAAIAKIPGTRPWPQQP